MSTLDLENEAKPAFCQNISNSSGYKNTSDCFEVNGCEHPSHLIDYLCNQLFNE